MDIDYGHISQKRYMIIYERVLLYLIEVQWLTYSKGDFFNRWVNFQLTPNYVLCIGNRLEPCTCVLVIQHNLKSYHYTTVLIFDGKYSVQNIINYNR